MLLSLLLSSLLKVKSDDVVPACHMTPAYPPPEDRYIGSYTINLDAPANERWSEPTTDMLSDIQKVVDLTIAASFMEPFRAKVNKIGVDNLLKRLPNDWGNEIISIANILNRTLTNVYLYNLAYSLMGFCTSIIAQDNTGQIYHGRNLDFGLWPAVNWTDVQWDLTTDLKKILFEGHFMKNGKLLYKTITYGGFIGLHTGIKPNGYSLSIDTRFDNNYDKYLNEYFNDENDVDQLIVMATRVGFEMYDNYDDMVKYMRDTPMVCPAYVIMGGVKEYEGVVMTYGPNMTLFNEWDMKNGLPRNNTNIEPYYLVQTNYDNWEPPPVWDDRRMPAELCILEIGQKGMGYYSMYNVLNGIPNRNRLTTFTALMSAADDGYLKAWKQYCDVKECIPW